MTTADLSSELPPADETWHEIERLLEEIAQLARGDIARDEFYRALLDRLLGALAAAGGAIWLQEPGNRLGIEYQVNLQAALGTATSGQQRHGELIAGLFRGGEAQLLPPRSGDVRAANPSEFLLLVCPVRSEGETRRVIEVLQRPESQPAVQRGYLQVVRAACELAEEFERRRAIVELRLREQEWSHLADYAERVHSSLDLTTTAYNIAHEARRVIGCDRASTIACRGRRPQVLAVSGVDALDRRATPVVRLQQLAERLLPTGEPLWYPAAEPLAPQIEAALDAFLDAAPSRALALLPLTAGEEEAKIAGFLAIERFTDAAGDDWQRRAEAACPAAAAALAHALDYDSIPLRSWWQALGRTTRADQWPRAAVVAGAILLVAAALVLIPADFTIEARGELQPQVRQHVFAPSDGIVVALPQSEEAQVQAGDVLARLHNPALDIQFSELVGKQRTTAEDLRSAEAALLVGDSSAAEATPRGELTARIEQLKEVLAGLDEQHAILRQQQADLVVRSPLRGTVLTWDVGRLLASRPVQQGELLMTVADLASPWELDLRVPDRQIGHVLAAQRGQSEPLLATFVLGTEPGVTYRGEVVRIAPTTEVDEHAAASVRLVASVGQRPLSRPRPGATVIARVHCGRRSLGYVWLHEAWEALRLQLWW